MQLVEVVKVGISNHSHTLSEHKTKQMSNINEVKRPVHVIRTIILSLLTTSLGSLFLPSPSMADREYFYRNCAELQKVMSDHNPSEKYEGFEKVKMRRRNLIHEAYIVYCNGGFHTTKSRSGTMICRGYIAYSFNPIPAVANYYARWGRTEGLPNDNDIGQEKYCRLIK